ncbi:MAG: shikimate dehydrogenase [Gammaproteobacteria bacterium]
MPAGTAHTPPDRYAVFGNPVAHSCSPWIHGRFAEQTGEQVHYEAILAAHDGFALAITAFHDAGGKGANVTLPFKELAWELAGERSERAEQARAVNTLVLRPDGTRYGDNTDGVGLVRDLVTNHGVDLRNAAILLLGAGGAARGIVAPLLEQRPARLVIANRTPERARQLAEEARALGPVTACGYDALGNERFTLIINATSAGIQGARPSLPDALPVADAVCYDLMYGAAPTPFLRWAAGKGARLTMDGIGMLVEQAAESFALWRSVRPDTAPVIAALRQQRG